jgi:hypothetical protein
MAANWEELGKHGGRLEDTHGKDDCNSR